MTDYTDIVERLREKAFRSCGPTMEAVHTKRYEWIAADAIESLEVENKKLREALEFYGWEDHWVINGYSISVCNEDRGRRARAALGDEQEYARKLLGGREEK